jgi:hypothetical protein
VLGVLQRRVARTTHGRRELLAAVWVRALHPAARVWDDAHISLLRSPRSLGAVAACGCGCVGLWCRAQLRASVLAMPNARPHLTAKGHHVGMSHPSATSVYQPADTLGCESVYSGGRGKLPSGCRVHKSSLSGSAVASFARSRRGGLCDVGELLDGPESPLLPMTMDTNCARRSVGVQPSRATREHRTQNPSAEMVKKDDEEVKPKVDTEVKTESGPSGGAPAVEVSEELLKATITTIISEGSLEELSTKKVCGTARSSPLRCTRSLTHRT